MGDKFDCEAGYSNWQAAWSSRKKVWCCMEHFRGCPTQEIHSPHSKLLPPAPAVTTTFPPYNRPAPATGHQFDCSLDFDECVTKWNPVKKAWCLHRGHHACTLSGMPTPVPTPVLLAPWASPAPAGPPARGYAHHVVPETGVVFNCHAGLDNCQRGWSLKKKVWCREHQRIECIDSFRRESSPLVAPSPMRPRPIYDSGLATSARRPSQSLESMPPRGAVLRYHCGAAFSFHRWNSWSPGKKAACCRTFNVCPGQFNRLYDDVSDEAASSRDGTLRVQVFAALSVVSGIVLGSIVFLRYVGRHTLSEQTTYLRVQSSV